MISNNTAELVQWLTKLNACPAAIAWVRSLPPDAGLNGAWAQCSKADWMLWLGRYLDVPPDVWRWCVCDFARSVLHLVPAGEDRPRIAVETAERYLRGEATLKELRAAENAAWDARTVSWASAEATAWATEAAYAADAATYAADAADAAAYAAADAEWMAAAVYAEESAKQADIIRARTAGLVLGKR